MPEVIFDINAFYFEGMSVFVYIRVAGDASTFGVTVIGVDLSGQPVAHDLRNNFEYLSASQLGYGRPSTLRLEFLRNAALPQPPRYKAILSNSNAREYATTTSS